MRVLFCPKHHVVVQVLFDDGTDDYLPHPGCLSNGWVWLIDALEVAR